jgi:ATP-dependent Clp protease ATP-binding subunit ClpA
MEVRTHIRIMKQSALTSEARGFSRRDVDMVTETDVSDVVSNWTGIPVTNYRIRISSIIKNGRLNSRTYYWSKTRGCISFKSD